MQEESSAATEAEVAQEAVLDSPQPAPASAYAPVSDLQEAGEEEGEVIEGASAAAPPPLTPGAAFPPSSPESIFPPAMPAPAEAPAPAPSDMDDKAIDISSADADEGGATMLPAIGGSGCQNAESFSSCFGNSISSQATLPPATPATPASREAATIQASTSFADSFASSHATEPVDISVEHPQLLMLLEQGVEGLRRLSPRTLEACASEGIEPVELLPKTLADFKPKDKMVFLKPEHQKARHERFERRRMGKLSDVVRARRHILNACPGSPGPPGSRGIPGSPESPGPGADAESTLVEERRRRAAESQAAEARRMQKTEEARAAAAATLAETARRAEEASKRLEEYEQQRARERDEKVAREREKRELKEARARRQLAEVEAKLALRAAATAEHEARRAEKMEAKQAAEEERRHAMSLAKLAKAEAAQELKNSVNEQRKERTAKMIEEREVRLTAHAEKEEEVRLQKLRDGLELHRKVQNAMLRVDQQRKEFEDKTQAHLDKKRDGNEIREMRLQERRKEQAQHAQAVLAARLELDRRHEQQARKMLEQTERKEMRRQATLALRAEAALDVAEHRKAQHEELLERVRRQEKKREYERQKRSEALKEKDRRHFAQVAALEQLQREKLTVKYKMEAEALKNGEKNNLKDMSRMNEPGPTSYDNRFLETGQLGPGGKYARVGRCKAPPAYSFGTRAEHQLPRVPVDETGKCLTVEIVGKESPGPGTALQSLGSREILDKTGKFPRQPAFSLGHLVKDVLNKDVLYRPGPGETHAEDRQLQLTRYKSAPAFSFGTKRFQEIREQEKKDLLQQKKDGIVKPSTADAAYARRNRGPGPTTYNADRVQTSLPRHRNLADGVGVSQRFSKGDRFIPLDTKPRDSLGPTTFVNKREAMVVPGPQKYRPISRSMTTRSYLSTPLAF